VNFKLICENPKDFKWGDITKSHTQLLEKTILNAPEYWLWSHNRLKKSQVNPILIMIGATG
jgi:KDO2-lipid IV(A) lauroyltransferase